jgi:hypothetical protein
MIEQTNGHIVVWAALRNSENEIILGVRHFDSYMQQRIFRSGKDWSKAEQGFYDNKGEFLTREEAWIVAEKSNQIIRRVGGDGKRLFSENCW